MAVDGLRFKRFLCLETEVAAKAYSVHSTAEVMAGVCWRVINPRDNMIGSRSAWVIIGRKVLECHKASFIIEFSMAEERWNGKRVKKKGLLDFVDFFYFILFYC